MSDSAVSNPRNDLLARAGRSLLRALFGLRVTVTGGPALSDDDPVLLLANHPTWLDGLLIASAMRREPIFVVQPPAENRPKRVTRMIDRLATRVKVAPGTVQAPSKISTRRLVSTAGTSEQTAVSIAEHLAAGQRVAAFPEMTRSKRPFVNAQLDAAIFDGAAAHAATGTLMGGWRVWPTWQPWRIPRLAPLEVLVHEPLSADELADPERAISAWSTAVNTPILQWFQQHVPWCDARRWFLDSPPVMPRWRHGARDLDAELAVQLGLLPRWGKLRKPGPQKRV